MPPELIRTGCRIWWPSLKLGGSVVALDGQTATVVLDNGDERRVNVEAGAIAPDPFSVGDRVINSDGDRGLIVGTAPSDKLCRWRVAWADGRTATVIEFNLRRAEVLDPIERMETGNRSSARQFNLRSVAADMWSRNQSQELVSLAHARVDLKPHQVSVAHRVVSEFPHRFLLCDEVGLGKTIEAAMAIKELRARGDARRVLILVPAGLQIQWLTELKVKFGENFALFNREKIALKRAQNVHNPWADDLSIITSHSFASYSDERIREIASVPWDLIIVDEAHHARRQRRGTSQRLTRLYRLVNELTARPEFSQRAVLFLTATPMQLQRYELFSLVEMLNHTLFASEQDFEQHLTARGGVSRVAEELDAELPPTSAQLLAALPHDWIDRAARILSCQAEDVLDRLNEPDALLAEIRAQHRLSEVMLRNRRAVVGGFMPRRAYRWELELSPQESRIQDAMEAVIREGLAVAAAQQRNAVGFLMVTWQKLLASSSRALRYSLERRCARLAAGTTVEERSQQILDQLEDEELSPEEVEGSVREAIGDEIERLREIITDLATIDVDSKARTLVEKLRELFRHDPDGKVLLFTQFRDTQDMLADLLGREGWGVHAFHGGLTAEQKDRAVADFHYSAGAQILISTEAGGEGRNLQFAHHLVNYDLPWNPMRVEQRIGRVDRFGQLHPVSVYNFHVHGSIEGRVLEVLEERIRLFEESIGGLEPILGDVEEDIRQAMRLAAADRDRAFKEIEERSQRLVEQGRLAESQMEDFVLDGRSYSAGIIELVHSQPATTVDQEDFERMLGELLASVNTWIGQPNSRGEREIQFHPPFTEEERDLLGGKERLSVCFDPRISVDSVSIEYFGFGHPIVDTLIKRVTEKSIDGAAAVRSVSPLAVPAVRLGWQFNWLLRAGGVRPTESVIPVFVDDDGQCDLRLGEQLLFQSRAFDRSEGQGTRNVEVPTHILRTAFEEAERVIAGESDQLVAERSIQALERRATDTERIERLYQNRAEAAGKRHSNDLRTLERMKASSDPNDQRVVPIWEENVRRSEAALDQVAADKQRELQALNTMLNPEVSYSLLCVARIVPAV